MNEIQRQQYLDALGVDSYMPRWILPLAPPPYACAPVVPAPPESDTPLAISAVAGVMPLGGEGRAVATEVGQRALPHKAGTDAAEFARMPASSDSCSAPTLPASPAQGAGQALAAISEVVRSAEVKQRTAVGGADVALPQSALATDPRFALSLWRISDKLLVIDSRHAELALPTEPLLANILAALGLPRKPLPKADVLRWPMYDYPLAPKGDDAARDTILAMLEGRLELEPVEYVLLMGAEACHYVLPAEFLSQAVKTMDNSSREHSSHDRALPDHTVPGLSLRDSFAKVLGKAVQVESLKVTAIVVPSLCDMLQQPHLKAQTWNSIQPLRQR